MSSRPLAHETAPGARSRAGHAIWGVFVLTALSACAPSLSDRTVAERSWAAYRTTFIQHDGRVVRPEHGHDSTSEGQAYAMLRAAWMDDRETFDRVWRWGLTRLARHGRPQPSLWAWHWNGDRVTDWQVASDADSDVALALVLAAGRWRDASPGLPSYRQAALATAHDLASLVVRDVEGTSVLLPGAWADERAEGRGVVLNPSYLAPATYRVLNALTGDSLWTVLARDSYEVLSAICGAHPVRAVPDWIRWTSRTSWAAEGADARSSWDAIRTPWRVATDALWFDAPEARTWLRACAEPYLLHARTGGTLALDRDLDGRAHAGVDHPLANAMYAFAAEAPVDRIRLLNRVRSRLVVRGPGVFFDDPDRYYVNSLAYLPFLASAGRMPRPSTDFH